MLAEKLSGSGAAAKTYIEDVLNLYVYNGTGSAQTLTDNIDRTQGALDIFKGRSGATDWAWYDTVRGVQKDLTSTSTAAQTTQAQGVTGVSSTGVTIGTLSKLNTSAATYLKASFRKAPKFFDVVTWTGDGVSGRQIPHGINGPVGMVILKSTNVTDNWIVWHRGISTASAGGLYLNTTAAAGATAPGVIGVSNTAITVDDCSNYRANASGRTYVAYLFAHDTSTDGLIQCGSYTGNGSATGPTISLGWEPQFVLVKNISSANSWYMFDTMRGMPVAGSTAILTANSSGAESASSAASYPDGFLQPLATGFRPMGNSAAHNSSGETFIYLAIRRGPMKPPTSGTQVYNAIARTGTGAAATVTGVGFPPDWALSQQRTAVQGSVWYDRLRGPQKYLAPASTGAEGTNAQGVTAFGIDGFSLGTEASVNGAVSLIHHFLRRYPGVFDQVCWTGTGLSTVTHNLNAVPELIIWKARGATSDWYVLAKLASGNYAALLLNSTAALNFQDTAANIGVLGSSTWTPYSSWGETNGVTYTAYLFATLPGISKVGSYTGNGSSQTIDCGFTAGARFVLIKRTDNAGPWVVFDSVRGIVAAEDPYLYLNSTAAENSLGAVDFVDPAPSGFIVNSYSDVNGIGGTYIYLAFA